ncbi:MAG: hypothetical protein J7K08_00045 [Thermoplasmata archaeon]|nr:hypothetical protein [Thermoplasmata archaeon]RLF53385.1 MAG: hypothetical protein DRN28_07065 [Thermoplasmata archaeon]RLF74438.1 MAG: hypothetical protein DRN55_00105 [Thermoplasmata archaeon]RLF76646.1 MAG: hypothetical protein DRN42_00595 [Thermoplasmata archaeon]HDD60355.1 hypothetical protein [Euryarchaeota archaeon]
MYPSDRKTLLAGIFIALIVIVGSVASGKNITKEKKKEEESPITDVIVEAPAYTESGQTNEGESTALTLPLDDLYLAELRITLTWEDEPPRNRLFVNEPDTFRLELLNPEFNISLVSEEVANPSGGEGSITLRVNFTQEDAIRMYGSSNWTVNVVMVNAGDQHRMGLFHVIAFVDSGNSWSLTANIWTWQVRESSS